MIDVCWKIWAQDSHVHHSKLREEGFYELLGENHCCENSSTGNTVIIKYCYTVGERQNSFTVSDLSSQYPIILNYFWINICS